jgi:hypothetical protein
MPQFASNAHAVASSGQTLLQVVTLVPVQAAPPTAQVPVGLSGQSLLLLHCVAVRFPVASLQSLYGAQGVDVLLQELVP